MPESIRVARLNDRTILRVFEGLARELDATIDIAHVGGSTWNSSSDEEAPDYGTADFLINSVDFHADGFRAIFSRGLYDPALTPSNRNDKTLTEHNFRNYRSPSAAFDEVFYTGSLSFEQSQAFDKALKPLRLKVSPKNDEDFLTALVTSQLDQLRELALDFSARQKDAEEKLEVAFQKRQADLDLRITNEEARLIEDAANQAAEIEEERKKLEKWREEINDREPQHERRRLRELLSVAIAEKLEPNAVQSRKDERKAAYGFILAGALLVFASLYLSITMTGDLDGASWFQGGKSLLAGLAGGAFLWAGLSNLRVANVSAREFEEVALRYRFDIDRASWVVETILQMNADEKTEIPSQWLESVCRNLFESHSSSDEDTSSLQAFSALFDATARARLGTDGFEFEVDRKGAKRIAQSRD